MEGDDGNRDWEWHHEWPDVIPRETQVTLTYGDGTVLRLPLDLQGAMDTRALSAVLPALLADLSA